MTDADDDRLPRLGAGRDGVNERIESEIVDIFESNPFVTASVVTLRNHLLARGFEVSEPRVRDCCEQLVEEGTLRYEREVYDRVKYSFEGG